MFQKLLSIIIFLLLLPLMLLITLVVLFFDGFPIFYKQKRIGKDNNIFFAYGHHHIGLTAGPKTGKMISKAIFRDNDQYDLKAFDPSR